MKLTVGVAQVAPAVLDLDASVERACQWIAKAGRRGVRVLAFPETWLTGYPFWCDTSPFAVWDGNGVPGRIHAASWKNALALPSPELDRLTEAAGEAHCAVVLGANERGPSGTIYNALVYLSEDGRYLGRHRKLVPTHGERLVWGHGDAAGLKTYDAAGVKVGGLVCWEHWMPLPRHVLHVEGEQVHVAVWPHAGEIHQLASRHYAFEGRAFVLVAGTYLERRSLPAELLDIDGLVPDRDLVMDGGSAIIAPDARYVVEPVLGREELLVAEIELDEIAAGKHTLDVAGHYARPDLFDVTVRRTELPHLREAPHPE